MVWQPAPVVTGDAVVLDVAIAQLPVRTLAALIDIVVIGIAYVVGVVLWSITLTQFDDALSAAILIIFTVLTLVGYPVVMETATRGRSLGKMALGLRVVAEDGGPERFRQALFRGLAGFVEIWMLTGGPAVICSLLSAKGRRLGDIFAGTVVISERGPKLNPIPVMPPALAWWAASLELSGLGPEQAELARQFLARSAQLDPRIRHEMGHRIFDEVASRISPPPPPGAPAEYVLAAVLAERHRRALARLMPQAQPMTYPSPYPTYPSPPTSGFTPPS
ncbi:RDD family protein [Mycolicibacterium setense]|uniref:Membrane protein n=1 Tax=Mycolicibacterium setense TaxID=431269 RepID=A0ABR4YMC2_9MYCO|nr:RDD family protein [Mycolicibacterium setense]KHO18093.1 membrane protein [Mycolicibacterium setense]KHO19882.1 membrane protein [Mycolicibacterium setense]MCV7112028.1 RDD family protein [Mycolicibacterium setense]